MAVTYALLQLVLHRKKIVGKIPGVDMLKVKARAGLSSKGVSKNFKTIFEIIRGSKVESKSDANE
jgi:hypothetical protein